MSDAIFVTVLCEGQTEQKFVKDILAPYLGVKNIFMTPVIISKNGQKGGDVKFQRVARDIGVILNQSQSPIVSTFIDYYGLKEWPGQDEILPNSDPEQIAECLNRASKNVICRQYDRLNPQNRYIPFVAVHEFETLLFSDSRILADHLHIERGIIDQVLHDCGSPENINNSPATAPSKRLCAWDHRYGKTTTGIAIAAAIGIDKMRSMCKIFDKWICELERKTAV